MRNRLLIIVVGGVVGALLWAGPGGAQPFPGGLPECVRQLNTCTSNLSTCTTSLTQTQGQLSTCNTSLGTCTTSLTTCQAALTECEEAPSAAVFPGDGVDGPALNYTDNGDTVTDNNTLLMWEKKTGTVGSPVAAACLTALHDVNSTCTWAQATGAWINAINAEGGGTGFAGHNDWRVPNVKELQSLVDYGVLLPGPTIDATFPGATAAGLYWSSTTYVGNSLAAWNVNFSNGFVMVGTPGTKTNSHRVRAVRGGR